MHSTVSVDYSLFGQMDYTIRKEILQSEKDTYQVVTLDPIAYE